MAASLSPLNELANNISESFEGLVSDVLGKKKDPNVPAQADSKEVSAVLSTVDASNWLKLSFPYTFSVVNIEGPNTNNPFTDFSLPLAPNSLKQSEPFAISVRAVQGGTSTTHSGNRYMALNIKGTTGIAPFRGDGGAKRKTGEAVFQPKSLKYRSGYEVFLRLRNWFRAYYEHKKSAGKTARGLRLVFKNYKDGEFLIVELLKFEMERSAARSFLYDYDLEFKVISHLTFQELVSKTTSFENALNIALDSIDLARGTFLRSQGILRQVESTFESVAIEPLRKSSLALKALLGVGTVAADMGSKAISNTVSSAAAFGIILGIQTQQKANKTTGTLDPRLAAAQLPRDVASAAKTQGASLVSGLGEALMAMDPSSFPKATQDLLKQEQNDSQKLPRSFYLKTLDDLQRVKQNAEDFFGLGSVQYDTIFDRTSTLTAPFTKVVTADELAVLQGFNDAMTGIRMLLATEDLFKSSFDERIQDMIDRFDGNIALFAEPAVKQIQYESGLTLERMAQREMGDSSRWGEIVEVNGLKAPYVTDDLSDPRPNILRPGSKVLIPIPAQSGFSQAPATKEIKTTKSLSELERSLGTDLKLTSDYDLSISNAGDLEVVSGYANMAQAVLINLGYGKGELMRYPEKGAGIVPGSKFPPLEAIKDGLTNTLLQDTRVQGIEDLSLIRDNGALYLFFNLKIKDVDVPVPIKVKI